MKKRKKFDKVKVVKAIARDRIGAPGTEKVVPDKRKKKLDEIREREAREDS